MKPFLACEIFERDTWQFRLLNLAGEAAELSGDFDAAQIEGAPDGLILILCNWSAENFSTAIHTCGDHMAGEAGTILQPEPLQIMHLSQVATIKEADKVAILPKAEHDVVAIHLVTNCSNPEGPLVVEVDAYFHPMDAVAGAERANRLCVDDAALAKDTVQPIHVDDSALRCEEVPVLDVDVENTLLKLYHRVSLDWLLSFA